MSFTGKAALAGVMGWPVGHSLSPRLHNYWLVHHGIDGVFVPLGVAPEHFAQAARMLGPMGFRGANATVPHKQAALAVVDEMDAAARRIGAVNTLIVRKDGSLFGINTDGVGFTNHLLASHPGFDAARAPAVVIGAGGAARAVAVALADLGAPEVVIVNRTLAHAERLARDLGAPLRVVDWVGRGRALGEAGILVNTTTQGMTGHPALDLPLDALPGEAVVFDVVYTPLETPLLKAAAARGNRVCDGLGMLLHQAVPGFEAWFGLRPEVTAALRDHVAAALGPARP